MKIGKTYIVCDSVNLANDAIGQDLSQYFSFRGAFIVKGKSPGKVESIAFHSGETSKNVWLHNIQTNEDEQFYIPHHLFKCFKEVETNDGYLVDNWKVRHSEIVTIPKRINHESKLLSF